ncbi:uncharacterized protein TNCV_1779791 [Trichonephila clavipes]|nr:uncharacterized protein TNCV_1779791 [Trichonephila clavipes]
MIGQRGGKPHSLESKLSLMPSSRKSSCEVGGREKRWEAPDHPQGVVPQNWGEAELNRSVTCMVLKATGNDRCHLALFYDEFRGLWSDICRSGGNSNNGNNNNCISIDL